MPAFLHIKNAQQRFIQSSYEYGRAPFCAAVQGPGGRLWPRRAEHFSGCTVRRSVYGVATAMAAALCRTSRLRRPSPASVAVDTVAPAGASSPPLISPNQACQVRPTAIDAPRVALCSDAGVPLIHAEPPGCPRPPSVPCPFHPPSIHHPTRHLVIQYG